MRNVFIIGKPHAYVSMFENARGWRVSNTPEEADVIQFTGGEDVSPDIYGQHKHPRTGNNPSRDNDEIEIFDWCMENKKKMAGICRGGQFLNVMCGGSLLQHVNHHAVYGGHEARCQLTGETGVVSSTHHQMMQPPKKEIPIKYKILMAASLCPHDEKEYCSSVDEEYKVIKGGNISSFDLEAILYPDYGVLCYQPHPEFENFEWCRKRYFYYLSKLF